MAKKKDTIASKVKQLPLYTSKITLQKYKHAVDAAEDIDYPNRYDLLQIYNDVVKDPHLASVLKHRKTRIKGLQFNLYKESGKTAKNTLKLFSTEEFKKFLDYAIDSIFYGNSLIEIFPNSDGTFDYVLIPRNNVVPEKEGIKIYPINPSPNIYYSDTKYSNTLVDINNNNNNRDLGELLDISKLVLFKNELLLNWSQYIELFGQPWRVATTNTTDPLEVNAILDSLKNVGRSGYFIKDSQTQLELIGNSSNPQSLFNSFADYIDSQVSKRILGASMITDDGSSMSQSKVHLSSSYIYTKADILFLEDVINYQLIPQLTELGYINESVTFAFTEPEILSIDEKLKVDQFLLDNFNLSDVSYFEDRYGTSLSYKTEPTNNIQ